MHSLDSRSRNFGVLILRHEDYTSMQGVDESNVFGALAKNVTGREPPEAGGRFIDQGTSIGNVMPAFLWPKDTRPAPAHFIGAAPAMITGTPPAVPSKAPATSGGGGGVTRSGGTVQSGGGLAGNPHSSVYQPQVEPTAKSKTTALPAESIGSMIPVKGTAMWEDRRFLPVGYATPLDPGGGGDLWPVFPKGLYGIAMPTSDEIQQTNLFFPCDPRLFAINYGDEPAMGSIVCDTDENDEIDPNRTARLQSAFRVIRSPYNSTANSIALQIGRSGNDDCLGGLVFDKTMGDVVAAMSSVYGGPFDVGDIFDLHRLGTDGDGNPINALHISLSALFKGRFNRDMDGPLLHEGYWKGAQKFPFSGEVHFEWDAALGVHRWRGEVPIYIPNTDTPTKKPPPDVPTPPDKPPDTPSGGGGEKQPPPRGGGVPPGAPGGGNDQPPAGGGPQPAGKSPDHPSGPSGDSSDGGDVVDGGDRDVPFGPDHPPGWTPAGDAPWGDKGAGKPPDKGGGTPKPKGSGDPPGGFKAGPLDGGDKGFGGWDPDPFGGLFGIKKGKNGSKKKQDDRAKRKAAKDAKRAKKKKDKTKPKNGGIRIVEPPDNSDLKIPGVNVPDPFRHGPGDKFRGLPQMRMMPPAIPNALSGDAHPEIPKGGGGGASATPTTITSSPTPGTVITPPARGPMPSGALPGPQCPPAMVNELMFPSWVARPQCFSRSAPDLRYDSAPNLIDVIAHDRKTPVTGHIQAYGAQGGTVGSDPGASGPNNWLYTVAPRAGTRWWQGSGNGGWWITTPETDLADMMSMLNPQNVTQSKTYFGVAPRVYFGAGFPDLAQGGMFTGYRWGADSSGNLSFDRMNSSGVAVDILELGADGIVSIHERGSGAGQGGQLELWSPDGTSRFSIQAPDSSASNLVLIMPGTDPIANDVMTVDSIGGGNVVFKWASAGSSPTAVTTLYATAVQTATTAVVTKEILQTYTIPAAQMSGDGDAVIVKAWGTFAANANTKTIRLEIGAGPTVIAYNNITPSPNGGGWMIEAKVMYRNAGQQTCIAQATVGAVVQSVGSTLTNENPSGTIPIYVSGQNGTASAGDIVCDGIEVENAPA